MINSSVKTIYLHIGVHKTGTSSIQATLAKNKDLLEQNSIFYPTKMGINHSEFLVPMFMDNPSEYYLEKTKNNTDEIIKQEYEQKKEILKLELLNTDKENIVFSGEDMSGMLDFELEKLNLFLKELFPLAKIKIVTCFREPSDYISSALQQSIKTGFCSVRPYEYKNIHYQVLIKKFATVFEIENLVIYDFEEAKKHADGLVGYFFEEVLMLNGIGTSNLKILRDNDSVSDIVKNILHYINIVTESDVFAKGLDGGRLKFERYINDTSTLWSLDGNKFKLDKAYVKELYEKLEPELEWIKDNFNIDYNFSNATYTEERFKIPDSFYITIKEAFPKLSRIVRRAFYEWLCEEIQTRECDELKELEQTKKWIEKNYRSLVSISLEDLKKQINQEIEAYQSFFEYFEIENKQSYQLYYHMHLLLKDTGEHKTAKVMLEHFYEKNPKYNDIWEKSDLSQFKFFLKEKVKKIINEKSLSSVFSKHQSSYKEFNDIFCINPAEEELFGQINLFLQKHNIKQETGI